MSVSLQFGRGHWNIPIGGFKLPPSELRNTKIKHAATPKTAGTRINTKHTPSHKEITNAHEDALPTIIADSQCLHAASRHMQYMADRRLAAMLPYRTWCQASTESAAVRHTAAGQQLVWRPVCLASLRANGDTDARHSLEEGRGKRKLPLTYSGSRVCFSMHSGAAFQLTADHFLHHLHTTSISIVCLKSPFFRWNVSEPRDRSTAIDSF